MSHDSGGSHPPKNAEPPESRVGGIQAPGDQAGDTTCRNYATRQGRRPFDSADSR